MLWVNVTIQVMAEDLFLFCPRYEQERWTRILRKKDYAHFYQGAFRKLYQLIPLSCYLLWEACKSINSSQPTVFTPDSCLCAPAPTLIVCVWCVRACVRACVCARAIEWMHTLSSSAMRGPLFLSTTDGAHPQLWLKPGAFHCTWISLMGHEPILLQWQISWYIFFF